MDELAVLMKILAFMEENKNTDYSQKLDAMSNQLNSIYVQNEYIMNYLVNINKLLYMLVIILVFTGCFVFVATLLYFFFKKKLDYIL